MNPTTKRIVAVLGLVGVAVTGTPALASAGDHARLYELTENMKLVQRKLKGRVPVERRIASAAITGVAQVGTPLCPAEEFASGPAGCAVNVQGSNNISLKTGLGTLQGTFATVIQGDNPVDGPEAVVLKGGFHGQMDFSPAILHQIPFGTVSGKVTVGRGPDFPILFRKPLPSAKGQPFTGVFRLPFVGNFETDVEPYPGVIVKVTLRQLFCPATPDPNPWAEFYGGVDLVYLDNVEAAATPAGRCLDIQPTELSLGAPLVRFDVKF
jgi:hypothetical protein